ncbi:MAG: glycoside hydrolase family 31 protein [bacterium]|nr:glycoside hydrolase family 31 protein [bacterium]
MKITMRMHLFLLSLIAIGTLQGKSYERMENGISILPRNSRETGAKKLIIRALTDDIVQIVRTPSDSDPIPSSLVTEGVKPSGSQFTVEERGPEIRLLTGKLIILLDSRTGEAAIRDSNDRLIFREGSGRIIPAVVAGEKVNHIQQSFQWLQGEALYGLGQHQEGTFNWRGHYVEMFQYNMRAVVPFLLSTNGYGILWDNCSYTKFNDTSAGSFVWSEAGDAISYFFIYGPEPDAVIRNYRKLTGDAPLFPKWTYGYIQSKERYQSQQEILDIAREYRQRRIPMDAVVLDWQYWDDGMWGQKSFNRDRFPDPEAMLRTLHTDHNAHFMISIWPKMSSRSPDHNEMAAHAGFLYPSDSDPFYDAFNPEARSLYWEQADRGLFSKGVDAWWCDASEPELDGWDLNCDAFRTKMKPSIGSGSRYMNAYSLMHAKGIYENQRRVTADKRVVNLTRSAFSGQQKYAAITWSGDITADWDVFRNQIPAGLNFCMSGIPYWTTDIGAFFIQSSGVGGLGRGGWFRNGRFDGGIADEGYKELYVRWFQYGAFCPIFRAHGTDFPREIWRFGEPGTRAYDTLLKFDNLRYRLMPYIYSTAWKVTDEGYTMMRGLAMDFGQDPHVFEIDDQFMFGPSILVNPVTRPGVTYRAVYLPLDADWYNFWTGERYSGGQTFPVPAPLHEMPLFVRAGSIVPMGPFIQYAAESADPIELRIYPGANGDFTLYEDENDNYNYEKGVYSTINLKWDDQARRLTIGKRNGSFPGMLKNRTFHVVVAGERRGTGVEITRSPDRTVAYSGIEQIVSF